ncbi:doublecortin domain-containing protein 2B isoform X3 [Melanerpes formicivorus]|uniref:doublecortin domain-containing protein 2B isoform X3 n=1 Tax=Melanerpes formicivorus TaxID=211600 RepID=UPI0035901920
MSSRRLAAAPAAKTVVVYRNGDLFFPGRRFVVSQKHFLTFEGFLNEVTKSIQAPLAVRKLYTPRQGHRVAGLEQLQDGCRYVAAGSERFQRLDYLSHGRKEQRGRRKRGALQLGAAAPWKGNPWLGWQQDAHLPCTIQLCRLDGTQVCSGEELLSGHYYVAVGNEEYKKLPYCELLVPQGSICRSLWEQPSSRHKKHHREKAVPVNPETQGRRGKVPSK